MQRLRNGMAASLFAAALATSAFWLFLGPQHATAQSGGTSNFDTVVVDQDIIVGDDGTFGGSLSVSGIIAASSYLTASGDLTTPGALTVTGNTKLGGTTDQVGALSDSNSALTVADSMIVDGAADAVQLTVQGHTAQTANPNVFVVENSSGTDALAVTGAGYVTVTQDLKVSDDLVVTDDASVGGILVVGEWERNTARNAITVTMNGIITPTGTFQQLTAAGSVSTASIAAGTAGDRLILYNTANQTITISDTGTLKLTGNIALGQFDTLSLISDGTNWVMLGTANN